MKKFIVAAAVAAFAVSSPALAAKDGKLSKNDSVGKVDFTTVIPNMVRISGLTDMRIRVTPEALNSPYFNRQDTESKYCVYSNIGVDGGYNVTVDGQAGTDNPFALAGEGGSALDYNVWVSDDANNSFRAYTFPGFQQTGFKTTSGGQTRPVTTDCSDIGGNNAVIHVGVDNREILAATAGTYKGTLTVTVSAL